MGLTAEIGEFLAGAAQTGTPPEAAATVTQGFVDCVGVIALGWDEPVARITRVNTTADTPGKALALAVAAHALDYDDTGLGGHPSAVLVPAILAEAEASGGDGRAMIAAYIAGYEVWAELIGRERDQHHRKGWHPSAVFGPLAAASAAAVLKRFDAETARRATAIAASLAGGIVGNFGSMTKPYQLARSAQSGLLAARLAEAGMTAAPDAIEHEAGFLAAISPQGRVDRARPTRLGTDWAIRRHGLNLKLYPMCYGTHRILDGVGELRRAHGFAASDIAGAEVEIGPAETVMLRNHRPQAPLEAKFSAEFAVAAMAVAGRCGHAELNEGFIRRPEVQDLMTRVTIKTQANEGREDPSQATHHRVRVALKNGGTLDSGPIRYALGNFHRPAPAEALWRKFADCATPKLGADAARKLFETVSGLAALPGAASILEMLPQI